MMPKTCKHDKGRGDLDTSAQSNHESCGAKFCMQGFIQKVLHLDALLWDR